MEHFTLATGTPIWLAAHNVTSVTAEYDYVEGKSSALSIIRMTNGDRWVVRLDPLEAQRRISPMMALTAN